MKTSIILMMMSAAGLLSCKQSHVSKDIGETEISDSIQHIHNKKTFNNKDIYSSYTYTDAKGRNVIIQNGFPRGGENYTDKKGDHYSYVIFWTQLINKTDHPLELNMEFPVDSYEVPSLPGEYYKVLILADTMTPEKFPLSNYGLKNLDSFLDKNIHTSAVLKRTVNPKESTGFYVIILCPTEGAHGTMRTGLRLKGQHLLYEIKVDGLQSSTRSNTKEITCGKINLDNLKLQK